MKDEFKITYTCGSGPGGQHKNKVETCVVITHIPTGLSERCQDTRSKIQNEKLAKERLVKRVTELKVAKTKAKLEESKKNTLREAGRVRTYNYKSKVVTDHRTGKKAPLDKVLNGDLDLLK